MNRSEKIISILIFIYIVFSYFSPLLFLGFGENIMTKNTGTLCLFLLLSFLLYTNELSNAKILFSTISVVFVIFLFSLVLNLSVLQTNYPFQQLFNIITIPIIIFVFYSVAKNNKIIKIILLTLVVCSLINSLIALFSLYGGLNLFDATEGVGRYIGFDETTGRVGGARGENYTGFWNVPALVYFLNSLFKQKIKILNVVGLLIAISGIVVSLSRSSVITALFAVILVFYINRRKIKPIYIILFSVLAFAIITSLLRYQFSSMNDIVYQDQIKRWDFRSSDFEIDRYGPWEFWMDEFLSSSILFGKGPGYIQSIVGIAYPVLPHNSSVDVLVEFGVFGLILFLLPIFYSIKLFFNRMFNTDYYLLIYIIIFISMFISLFFLSNPYLKNYWLFWGLIWGRYDFLKTNKNYIIKMRILNIQKQLKLKSR